MAAAVEPKASDIADALRERIAYVTGAETDGFPNVFVPCSSRTTILETNAGDLKKLFTFLVWAGCNGFARRRNVQYNVVSSLYDSDWSQVRGYVDRLESVLPPGVQTLFLITPQQKVSLSRLSRKTSLNNYSIRIVAVGMKTLLLHIPADQLTSDFGGTMPYDHGDWVDMFLRFESSIGQSRQQKDDLSTLNRRMLDTNLRAMTMSTIEEKRESFGTEIKACLATTKQCHARVRLLLSDLQLVPCRYQLCTTTRHFGSIATGLSESLVSLDMDMDTLEANWRGKLDELEQTHSSLKYVRSLDKCRDTLQAHLHKLHANCDVVGNSSAAVSALLDQHALFIESAQVDLLVMKSLFDKYTRITSLEYCVQADLMASQRDQLSKVGDQLAHDLARRNIQLEKANKLHAVLQEAEELCDSAYRELAAQGLEQCMTGEGCETAVNSLDGLRSQVLLIPDSKLASMAKEMPVTSSLVHGIEKLVLRKQDIVQMLQVRIDAIISMASRFSMLRNQIETLSAKHDVTSELGSLYSLVSPDAVSENVRADSITASGSDLSPHRACGQDGWDTDPGTQLSNIGGHRSPKRSSSLTVVRPKRSSFWGNGHSIPEDEKSGSSEDLKVDEEDDLAVLSKRKRIAQELVETEKIYITDVRDTLDTYWSAMNVSSNSNVPHFIAGKQTVVFNNLPRILEFHDNIFLDELEECKDDPSLLGKCFVKNCDQFQLYLPYCKNKHRSDIFFDDYEGSFFEELRIKRGHRLGIRDYLIKPVQRITKYQLLLKDMLKNCGRSPSAQKTLQMALDQIVEILHHVNDIMHSSGIIGFPGSLLEQGHVLMQETFHVLASSAVQKVFHLGAGDRERQIFLYEQVVIVTKKHPPRLGQVRTVYNYKDHIKLSELALTETVGDDPCRFQVSQYLGKKGLTLQARNLDTKRAWVTRIRQTLERQLRIMQDTHQREEIGVTSGRTSTDYKISKYSTLPTMTTMPTEPVTVIPKTLSLDNRTSSPHSRSRSCSPLPPNQRANSLDWVEKDLKNVYPSRGGSSPRKHKRSSEPDSMVSRRGIALRATVARSHSIGFADLRHRRKYSPGRDESSGSGLSRHASPSNSIRSSLDHGDAEIAMRRSPTASVGSGAVPATTTTTSPAPALSFQLPEKEDEPVTVKRVPTGKKRSERRRSRKRGSLEVKVPTGLPPKPVVALPEICLVPATARLVNPYNMTFTDSFFPQCSDESDDFQSSISDASHEESEATDGARDPNNLAVNQQQVVHVKPLVYTECDL